MEKKCTNFAARKFNWHRRINLLIFVIFISLSWINNAIANINNEAQTVPADQKIFVEKVLIPIINDITVNYPVKTLRLKVVSTLNRHAKKWNNYPIAMSSSSNKQGGIGAAIDGRIIFFVPVVMMAYKETSLELFKDRLVDLILHEEYHLIHDGGTRSNVTNSRYELLKAESTTWWHQCKNVIALMFAADRLKGLPQDDAIFLGWRSYINAKGNQNSDAWKMFTTIAIGTSNN